MIQRTDPGLVARQDQLMAAIEDMRILVSRELDYVEWLLGLPRPLLALPERWLLRWWKWRHQ